MALRAFRAAALRAQPRFASAVAKPRAAVGIGFVGGSWAGLAIKRTVCDDDEGLSAGFEAGSNAQGGANPLGEISMNCPASAIMSGVMGTILGGGIGGIFGVYGGLTDPEVSGMQKRLRLAGSNARSRAPGMAKAFGAFSIVFEAFLCIFEKHRAVTDVKNHMYAGCLTGGVLGAWTGGPSAACMGCVMIGGFSGLIEMVMHGGD